MIFYINTVYAVNDNNIGVLVLYIEYIIILITTTQASFAFKYYN